MQFIVEENILIYVDFSCDITFYPETPTKIRQINWERNYIYRSWEKAKCIPSNDQHKCSLMSSKPPISFWTRTVYGTRFQQLLCHSTTLTIETLCPTSTLNQQLTNLEQTHTPCSFHCERWTAKAKDCASTLHSFREITYRTDEWTKQLLRLKSWVISWSPEQWMEFRRLWWTVIAFKCSYLFQLFVFYCLLVRCLLFFFKKINFLFLYFDEFEWEVKVRLPISVRCKPHSL